MPHARIYRWMIVECVEPDGNVTQHIQGYIYTHGRLSRNGEHKDDPYISRDLRSHDLARGIAVNSRGKTIELFGPRLPEGDVPFDLLQTQRRAAAAWQLPAGTTWRRIA
ncbi:MAG TPA: hypothetical protein VIL69_19115 [Roseomonas sp.]